MEPTDLLTFSSVITCTCILTCAHDNMLAAWMFFLIACASLLFTFLKQFCLAQVAHKLSLRVRGALFGALLRQEVRGPIANKH